MPIEARPKALLSRLDPHRTRSVGVVFLDHYFVPPKKIVGSPFTVPFSESYTSLAPWPMKSASNWSYKTAEEPN